MIDADRVHLGGAFDGDGCIIVANVNGYYQIRVGITNIFLPYLLFVKQWYGGSLNKDSRRDKEDWSLWITARDDVHRLLYDIIPYIFIKRDQVQIVIDFIEGKTSLSWEGLKLELQRMKRVEYTDIDEGRGMTVEFVRRMYSLRELGLLYAYIAGLMDTDGTINICGDESDKESWVLSVSIGNSHLPIIKSLQIILGKGRLRSAETTGRMTWNLGLVARDAKELIENILPHLNIKRLTAQKALEFQAEKRIGRNQYTPKIEKDLAYSKQIRVQRQMKALQNIRFPEESKTITYLEKVPIF